MVFLNKPSFQVEADDSDEGLNSMVSYSIVSGNVQNAFTIDENTGEIKVDRDLDRENIHQFVLGVQARDGEKLIFDKLNRIEAN